MAGTVRLRLSLQGYRNHRIYHIVAARRFKARDSHPIETLAVYDPRLKPNTTTKTVEWSVDRINYWLRQGAEPTKSVLHLLTMVSSITLRWSVGGPRDADGVGFYITGRDCRQQLKIPQSGQEGCCETCNTGDTDRSVSFVDGTPHSRSQTSGSAGRSNVYTHTTRLRTSQACVELGGRGGSKTGSLTSLLDKKQRRSVQRIHW